MSGLIDIVETYKPISLGNYNARVYIVDIHYDDLKAYSEYLNDTTDWEWLYSDPSKGGYSTPVSTLIQQDSIKLNKIRMKTHTFAKQV